MTMLCSLFELKAIRSRCSLIDVLSSCFVTRRLHQSSGLTKCNVSLHLPSTWNDPFFQISAFERYEGIMHECCLLKQWSKYTCVHTSGNWNEVLKEFAQLFNNLVHETWEPWLMSFCRICRWFRIFRLKETKICGHPFLNEIHDAYTNSILISMTATIYSCNFSKHCKQDNLFATCLPGTKYNEVPWSFSVMSNFFCVNRWTKPYITP